MRQIHIILLLFFSLLTACGTPDSTGQASVSDMASTVASQTDTSQSTTVSQAPSSSALPAQAASTQAADQYTDPFAYCAAVTTIDAADDRFVGDPVPQAIVQGLHQVTGGQGAPPDWLPRTISWRCMEGKVYACSVGANLPCSEKANTSQLPTEAAKEFCRNNPNHQSVKDKTSIYVWACADGTPKRGDQWTEADAAGFLAKIWYEINGS